MREFAEQEIVLPTGPDKDTRFTCERQPFTGLLFDAIDSGSWNRIVMLGPRQSGKTMAGFHIPSAFHLFEMRETVVQAIPTMEMSKDKWVQDFRPVLECTRYKDLLPTSGSGSRGGKVESITFRHGPTLKYMSGGGGDKRRAGFNTRVVIVTETDELDESGGTSREADKITQIENCIVSFADNTMIYMECTVTTTKGRTWREYKSSTESRIATPCPHCHHHVTLGRNDLRGWQDAETEEQARRQGHFKCPKCDERWSDADRIASVRAGKLLHRGQTITRSGKIRGKPPETRTLGFRWSAADNLFWTPGYIAAREWRARRDPDEENAEKEMCQFVWALPYEPPEVDMTPLRVDQLQRRTHAAPRGMVPAGVDCLTAYADLGKFLLHWMAIGWQYSGRGFIVDYGRIEIATDDFGVERATMIALQEYRDRMLAGFARSDDEPMVPQFAWIDSAWADTRDVVYQFCRGIPGDRFLPTIGRGETQRRMRKYNRPSKKSHRIIHIGEEYHFALVPAIGLFLVEINSDYWKSWVHERLACPIESPTALTFFAATPNEHMRVCRHITAERQIEEYNPGKGVGPFVRWEQVRRANHWLDTLYNCAAEAHHAGVHLLEEVPPPASPTAPPADSAAPASAAPAPPRHTRFGERPFLITER